MKYFSIAVTIIIIGVLIFSGGMLKENEANSENINGDIESLVDTMVINEESQVSSNKNLEMKKSSNLPDNPNYMLEFDIDNLEEIYLAGGCFWGLEAYMSRIYGVYDVTSGYANGNTENPKYEDLFAGSGHAETVHVLYDPGLVDLETLLGYYFRVIDPTSLNKQGNDRGAQYRTGIYYTDISELVIINNFVQNQQSKYTKDIVVEIEALDNYYIAEEYHQDYLEKNPNGYCHIDLFEVEDVFIDENKYPLPSQDIIKEKLTELQFKVTQENGTEMAFSHSYHDNKEKGIYVDIVTGEPLFSSNDKYDSKTGWPSFTRPITPDVVKYIEDRTLSSVRVEVRSRSGDSHLGHVFEDGPVEEGGLRYCINGSSLEFIPYDKMSERGYSYLLHIIEN